MEDNKWMCPSECKHCVACKEFSEIFIQLQELFFFQPNTMLRCLSDDKPFQSVMWKVFTRNTDKNNKQFRIEIAKSIPHIGLVTDYGQTY